MSLDRYRIEARLGGDDRGDVHRAFDTRLQREVVLRIMRGGDDLLREARAVAALRHPNIVIVYDVEATYIAMELVDGRLVVEHGDAPLARKLGWLRDIAKALSAAHAVGLVHRGLRAEHVMVDRAGIAKVRELGVAATSDDARAADQRAWAAIAIELIAGRRIDDAKLADAAIVDSGASAAVAMAIARALEARWPSVDALVAALDAAGVESVVVAPEPLPETRPTAPLRPVHVDVTVSSDNLAGQRASRSAARRPSPARRWLYAGGVAIAGAVAGGLLYRMRAAPPRPIPSCELAAEIPLEGGRDADAPIDVVVCEGHVAITMDGVGPAPAIEAYATPDGPLVLRPFGVAGLPEGRFARPICHGEGTTAFVGWGDTVSPRYKTVFEMHEPPGRPTMSGSWHSEVSTPSPCAIAVHPAGRVKFMACEQAAPDDPRMAWFFVGLMADNTATRDLGPGGAKPRAITAAYPFADRPFVAYRAGDRIVGLFPSPFGTPNESRIELARGVIGDPVVAAEAAHVIAVWPEARSGTDYVLHAASITLGGNPEPIDISEPESSAEAPSIAVTLDGLTIAWTDRSGALQVGSGADLADAIARARPIAQQASRPRVAVRGKLAVVTWRSSGGKPHVHRLDCQIRTGSSQ